jgi:hypothetical protein
MAYHPFTPDTQLVKVDDVTWEWRAEKDYADDDEGFAEQFRLSLQSSERASRFQHYVARSNRQNRGLADAAFSGPSPAWTAVQHVSLVDNAEVRNPFLAALPQHPFGRVGSAQASTNSFVTTFPQPAAPGSSPTPGSNPFAAYKPAEAATHAGTRWRRTNSSLLHKKRSGATRSPDGKRSSMPSSAPPSTAPRRTSSAPQVMTGRSSTKSIASQPSQRFVLGARVMSHRSRWRVAPPRNASLTMEARWKLPSSHRELRPNFARGYP